jgi:hypothetical protein
METIQCDKAEVYFDKNPGEKAIFIGFWLILLPHALYCNAVDLSACRQSKQPHAYAK